MGFLNPLMFPRLALEPASYSSIARKSGGQVVPSVDAKQAAIELMATETLDDIFPPHAPELECRVSATALDSPVSFVASRSDAPTYSRYRDKYRDFARRTRLRRSLTGMRLAPGPSAAQARAMSEPHVLSARDLLQEGEGRKPKPPLPDMSLVSMFPREFSVFTFTMQCAEPGMKMPVREASSGACNQVQRRRRTILRPDVFAQDAATVRNMSAEELTAKRKRCEIFSAPGEANAKRFSRSATLSSTDLDDLERKRSTDAEVGHEPSPKRSKPSPQAGILLPVRSLAGDVETPVKGAFTSSSGLAESLENAPPPAPQPWRGDGRPSAPVFGFSFGGRDPATLPTDTTPASPPRESTERILLEAPPRPVQNSTPTYTKDANTASSALQKAITVQSFNVSGTPLSVTASSSKNPLVPSSDGYFGYIFPPLPPSVAPHHVCSELSARLPAYEFLAVYELDKVKTAQAFS